MMFIVSLLVGAVASGVNAMALVGNPGTPAVLPKGYTVVPFSMKGAIEPGGEIKIFNGTVTDIFEQIQSIKPDFKWDDFQPANPSPPVALSKRSKEKILCNIPDYQAGYRVVLLRGYDFLKKINQPCTVDGGPKKCALLYCSAGTSIWMCNDNTDPITRDCGRMADYVLDIVGAENCQWPGPMGPATWTQGQEFDTDNFNIIAGGGGC